MGYMVNVTPWPIYRRENAPVTIILSCTNINLYAFLHLIFDKSKQECTQVLHINLYILLHIAELLFLYYFSCHL